MVSPDSDRFCEHALIPWTTITVIICLGLLLLILGNMAYHWVSRRRVEQRFRKLTTSSSGARRMIPWKKRRFDSSSLPSPKVLDTTLQMETQQNTARNVRVMTTDTDFTEEETAAIDDNEQTVQEEVMP